MAVSTEIMMLGPGASGYNSVTAQGAWANAASLPEDEFHAHTATLPKVVMIFNHTAATTDDGFWSATMPNMSHFNWATGAYSALSGMEAYLGVVDTGEFFIRDGVITQSVGATDDSDSIIGFHADGETMGGASNTLVYSCLGSFTRRDTDDPGYHWWDDDGGTAPQ